MRACSTLITSRSWIQLELLQKNRWIWCKVYAIHELSIAQRIHQLRLNFCGLTRYPKKSKTADQYKELETHFLHDADKLFDIFCYDNKQRKPYEIIYGLRITFNDHAFFEDQKAAPKATCLAEISEL